MCSKPLLFNADIKLSLSFGRTLDQQRKEEVMAANVSLLEAETNKPSGQRR